MQLNSRFLTGALLIALCGFTYASLSTSRPWQDDDSTLSEQQVRVLAGVGTWEGQITMHMPGVPPGKPLPCSEVVTAIGDLWTTSRFEMDFMGETFTGSSTFGYDTVKEKYVGTWVDIANPTITHMEGVFDKGKNAVVMDYDMYDPMAESFKKARSEHVATEDSYVLSFFDVTDEGAVLNMKIEMTRK